MAEKSQTLWLPATFGNVTNIVRVITREKVSVND